MISIRLEQRARVIPLLFQQCGSPFNTVKIIAFCISILWTNVSAQNCRIRFWEITEQIEQCCDGGWVVGDGAPIYIYWDRDEDGPDETDSLAPVGTETGQWNYNTFLLNGESMAIGAGHFRAPEDFVSVNICPEPTRFYLRISAGPALWTSSTMVFDSAEHNLECDGWTCENRPDSARVCRLSGAPYIQRCFTGCNGAALEIYVDGCDSLETPRMRVLGGCGGGPVCSEPECAVGVASESGFLPQENWTWTGDEWHYVLSVSTSGCFCITWTDCDELSANESPPRVANDFTLSQNFPNPFNPTTEISFTLATETDVTLRVFDLLGREVGLLMSGRVAAGEHRAVFDGSSFTSGVYFYRLEAGGIVETRKMLLLR